MGFQWLEFFETNMRIRSIKPEFCTDEKIGSLTREERLHFVLLWMAADRHGTIDYKPRQLGAMLYPFDEDMEKARFEALTSAVLQKNLCSRFSIEGRDYLHITNFEKHQSLTTWERKDSTPVLPLKALRKYCGSTAEVLRSEERRGEESTEPPNPQGGLSEGELKFQDLKAVLVESGKVPETITERDLAVAWRNVVSGKEPNADPRERGLLDHIRAALNLHAGRIGSPAQWIAARAAEFQEQKKQAGRPISSMGPGA